MTSPLPFRPEGIAFDLDGTLLNYEGQLADSTIRGVRRIKEAGIGVFIVTGRLQSSAEKFWRALELDTPLVCCNGGYVGFMGEEPFHHTRLSEEVRRKLVDINVRRNIYFNYAIDDTVYCLKDGEEREYYSKAYAFVEFAAPEELMAKRLPTKCLGVTSAEEQPAVLELLRAELGDAAEITTSNPRFIEIMPPEVNKGKGLAVLAKWAGAAPEEFVAVGDAMNDAPMLERAGYAVSFTSGDPRMAEYADILIPPLWEGGIDVLTDIVLNPGEKA